MAKINLVFCDLCRRVSLKDFKHQIVLRGLNDKEREGDICDKCFNNLVSKLEREIDLNRLSLPQMTVETEVEVDENVVPPKKLANGETVVPSRVDNIKPLPPSKQNCKHSRSSFEPPGQLICHDCEEVWEA